MKLVIMGPPGSGKSTQAELLEEELGIPHLQTGDLFHYLAQEDTPQGKKLKEIMESGGLIEDEFALEMVEKRLEDEQYEKGFILDGTPRSLWQAQNFKVKLDKVIYLKVSDEVNLKRLMKRGRKDDTPETVRKRLRLYHQTTEPMLKYYREKGLLVEVNGEGAIEEIFEEIMGRLKE